MCAPQHNVLVFKPAAILACGLAVLASCTTTPRDSNKPRRTGTELPPDWDIPPANQPATIPPPVVLRPRVTADISSAAPSPALEMKWLSLNHWCEERGLAEPRRLPMKTLQTYSVSTANGILIVTAGSRTAYWNSLDFRLGFAPQIINGHVFVHALDARKNLEPLLQDFVIPDGADRIIVIDAGHGGSNTGTRSVVDGRWEKEFTLDWAIRLAGLLATNGWRVFLTRVDDMDVSLAERVAYAEKQHACLFLSLHFNSSGEGARDQGGLETYCLTPAGMPSSLTREFTDDVTLLFPNNAFDEQNFQYALRIHRALLEVNGNADRGVRRARFLGVLRGQQRPAVLIEAGYLSNPLEARRIADPAYRQKLAEAVAKALA